MKYLSAFLLSFLLLAFISAPKSVNAAGECGKDAPDRMAYKLMPCASAAMDPQATPSAKCCSQVHTIGENPACLCAVMMSNTARSTGIKPEVAMSIPKRCNLDDRPIGYKCGAYTLP